MQDQQLLDKVPKEKIMKRLIRDNFKYERRKYIFLTVNTINLVLFAYNDNF